MVELDNELVSVAIESISVRGSGSVVERKGLHSDQPTKFLLIKSQQETQEHQSLLQ